MTRPTPEARAELRRQAELGCHFTYAEKILLLDALDAAEVERHELQRIINADPTLYPDSSELASARALSEAERAVIDAAIYFCGPAEPGHCESDCFIRIEKAVDALLALRKDRTDGA